MKRIVNGECLKDYFLSQQVVYDDVLSVNELFVEGPLQSEIFSRAFMNERKHYLHETYEIPLSLIDEKSSDLLAITSLGAQPITLWFDEDVFCQINLLVVLAYFSQRQIINQLTVKLIPQQFYHVISVDDEQIMSVHDINIAQADMIYQDVLVNKQYEKLLTYNEIELFRQLPALKEALRWYIKLQQMNNELVDYIEAQDTMNEEVLVKILLSDYSNLGLTDMQYRKLIRKVRG
ncbi:MAG TPA: hypothetical protein DCY20_00530 [Firmicutes bacterium]|nr:hypothetical protein [Bacillota bacterium]